MFAQRNVNFVDFFFIIKKQTDRIEIKWIKS